jgi:peptidoglycan/LPS O-acetylase OafA/YrhL
VRPLVGVGRISYGLYLYHMPIFQLVQSWHLGYVPTMSLEFGASAAVAIASWFCLEQPVQHWVARRWLRSAPETPDCAPAPVIAAYPPGGSPVRLGASSSRVRLSPEG